MSQETALLRKIRQVHRHGQEIRKSKFTDVAVTLREQLSPVVADKVNSLFGQMQDKLDSYIYLEKNVVDNFSGTPAGVSYLFSQYNSDWFEASLFSEQCLIEFAAHIIEATRQFDDNPFLRKLLTGEYRLHDDKDDTEELLNYELSVRNRLNITERVVSEDDKLETESN